MKHLYSLQLYDVNQLDYLQGLFRCQSGDVHAVGVKVMMYMLHEQHSCNGQLLHSLQCIDVTDRLVALLHEQHSCNGQLLHSLQCNDITDRLVALLHVQHRALNTAALYVIIRNSQSLTPIG
jgi:hypothetical protein